MPPRSPLARIGAALLGVVVLLCSALFSFGSSLVAPAGVFVGRYVSRRRGRTPTRLTSWIGAMVASWITLALLVAAVILLAPSGSLHELREASRGDSTVRNVPPPAWMTRMFPQAAQRPSPAAERLVRSSAFTGYVLIESVGLMLIVLGAVGGSGGWAATSLLEYAFTRGPAP